MVNLIIRNWHYIFRHKKKMKKPGMMYFLHDSELGGLVLCLSSSASSNCTKNENARDSLILVLISTPATHWRKKEIQLLHNVKAYKLSLTFYQTSTVIGLSFYRVLLAQRQNFQYVWRKVHFHTVLYVLDVWLRQAHFLFVVE